MANVFTREENFVKDVVFQNGDSLWEKYERIGTLHLPKHTDIPHREDKSPFASVSPIIYAFSASPTDFARVCIDNVDNQSDFLTMKDGVLYSKDMARLIFCVEEKETFIVPESVSIIEPYAFCSQKKLRSITLHDGIGCVGDGAFMGCAALETFTVSRSITCINWRVFDGCVSLREIHIPDSVVGIGGYAFRHCDSLKRVALPRYLEFLNSFECCGSLEEIEIPAGVEIVGGFMFCSSLKKVTLHEGVKRISEYAFRYCDKLKHINFPEGLEKIGSRAFYPSNISQLEFPASLKEVGVEAFYYNKKLKTVKFNSCVDIEMAAFACCPRVSMQTPPKMRIKKDVFEQNTTLDRFAFWD